MGNTRSCEEIFGCVCGEGYLFKDKKKYVERGYGDHVAEFGRLFDYIDVLLQTNPGSTCVVKVTEQEYGKKSL